MNWQESIAPLSTETENRTTARRGTTRATLIAVGIIILVMGGLYAFNTIREDSTRTALRSAVRPALIVNTEILKAESAPQTLQAVGSLTAVHQVTVSSEVSGQIGRIAYTGGDKVRKGDILVEMNVQRERADLDSARAQLQLAELALRRTTDLQTRGNVSQAQLDQAKSQYDVAKANVTKAEVAIAYKVVRAPFDGLLGTRDVEVGQYISPGQKLAELTDLTQLYINFTAPEQQRPRLAIGQTVELTVDAYPGRQFIGKLSVINPQIDPAARTIKLQATTDNKDGVLNPGMFANALVLLPPVPDTITVPETSVMNSLYGDYVYVAVNETKDGKERIIAKRAPVTLGQHYEGRVAILKGLNAGDRVVTTGLTKIAEGSVLTLTDENSLVKPTQVPVQ
jgi:multidrug efflux system membrane fusion protein